MQIWRPPLKNNYSISKTLIKLNWACKTIYRVKDYWEDCSNKIALAHGQIQGVVDSYRKSCYGSDLCLNVLRYTCD